MPYYCTVPRCTSMAGKAKNVSFHQFPKDEELAEQWNTILRRFKPYTKYSKVCSLHFTPEDYIMTKVGKHRGLKKTLRKTAIPSQKLPPGPLQQSEQGTVSTVTPEVTSNSVDTKVQQQVAQAIYVQTMLAMAATIVDKSSDLQKTDQSTEDQGSTNSNGIKLDNTKHLTVPIPKQKEMSSTELQDYILQYNAAKLDFPFRAVKKTENHKENVETRTSYKCKQCSRCFKDPDVFTLHKRSHNNEDIGPEKKMTEQEQSNPILSNLLKENPTGLLNAFKANQDLKVKNECYKSCDKNQFENEENLTAKDENNMSVQEFKHENGDNNKTEENITSEFVNNNIVEDCNDSKNLKGEDGNCVSFDENAVKHCSDHENDEKCKADDNRKLIDENNSTDCSDTEK